MQLQGRDLLSIADLTAEDLEHLLQLAAEIKAGRVSPQCRNQVLGLLFYKASTRTRVSFTTAMYRLGGHVIDLNPSTTQVGRGEPIEDTARVLSRYLDAIAIRTFAQDDIAKFAQYADIPVINALSDLEHPCQIIADLLTVKEQFGTLSGITLAYVGDGNNVAHSLLLGCALAGMHVRVASPPKYQPQAEIYERARSLQKAGMESIALEDPLAAVKGAQVLYTDVWASMGQESLSEERTPIFQAYRLDDRALELADPEAIVLHCLPAHRGEEITNEVIEGAQSRVWEQAENRMHAQQALLASLLGLV